MKNHIKSGYMLIVQPILAVYRIPIFNELASSFRVTIVASDIPKKEGFESGVFDRGKVIRSDLKKILGGKVTYQTNVIKTLAKERPEFVLINFSIRSLSFWMSVLVCKLLGIKLMAHGQGLYRTGDQSLIKKYLYRGLISLVWAYVCYTDMSRSTLNFISKAKQYKLFVADNMIKNSSPLTPFLKEESCNRILFIGRVRQESELSLLIEALEILSRKGFPGLALDIIGDGVLVDELQGHPLVKKHGVLYDDHQIALVAKKCKVGCYPGNAGLSVLHLMSLSLPVVVHDDMGSHMGPEPSYVSEGINGLLFEKGSAESLASALGALMGMNSDELLIYSKNAFDTYKKISSPDMAEKIITYINSRSFGEIS